MTESQIKYYISAICSDVDEQVYWDEKKYTYEQFHDIIEKTVRAFVAEYEDEDGEIDDYDYFEQLLIEECNDALGN